MANTVAQRLSKTCLPWVLKERIQALESKECVLMAQMSSGDQKGLKRERCWSHSPGKVLSRAL